MYDEEVPYRSAINLRSVKEDTKFTKDEEEQSTLRRVHKILKDAVAEIDAYRVFDLAEGELKLKYQIKARRLAADIVIPTLDLVEQALATIDEKFRQRNNQ